MWLNLNQNLTYINKNVKLVKSQNYINVVNVIQLSTMTILKKINPEKVVYLVDVRNVLRQLKRTDQEK
jgi:hypothetical protein